MNFRNRIKRPALSQDRARRLTVLPQGGTLDLVLRYESHVSRQMLRALHTLERLQAARAGVPVTPQVLARYRPSSACAG
jgi:hypothetical protein